jgi:uncharacterized protein (DUF433 family)
MRMHQSEYGGAALRAYNCRQWQRHTRTLREFVRDPAILAGKPAVKGSRISVEAVLAHLAGNPDLEELFAAFPRLTIEDLKACLAFAEEDPR